MSEGASNQHDIRIAEPGEACPNCGASLLGQWCYRCGQNQRSIHRFFLTLVAEALEDVFSLSSRTGRTFFDLMFRPGFIATEYFAGRRARYLPPVRVYLITSFVFFFLLSLQNMIEQPTTISVSREGVQAAESTEPSAQGDRRWHDELGRANVELGLPWLTTEQNEALQQRWEAQVDKLSQIAKEDPGQIMDAILDVVPPALFVLLPLFALLLKIFYFSFGFYYVEHLILAVNNHCFLFTALILETLLGFLPEGLWGARSVSIALLVWIPIYMYLSLKTVYRQGHFATFVNFSLLGLCYSVLLAFATAAALLVGLWTL